MGCPGWIWSKGRSHWEYCELKDRGREEGEREGGREGGRERGRKGGREEGRERGRERERGGVNINSTKCKRIIIMLKCLFCHSMFPQCSTCT